ncbi:MAG: S26 family signal peptidase [Thermoguttaceae bacterium]|nr:S26 family signal peptidase [Thermoguttaceae bacterium]
MKLLFLILLLALFSGCKPSEGPLFAEVEGISMLPELHGRAILETCPKCQFQGLRCATGTSVCPNCGWLTPENERAALPHENVPPDLLRVERKEKYEHDDLVVFVPSPEIGPVVKRVLGVPGDWLEIRDGVLYRNGKRVVHSLETWRKTRILVFHDDFRPEGRSRWKVSESREKPERQESPGSQKTSETQESPELQTVERKDGWELKNPAETLTYEHERARLTSAGCRFTPGPITNQRAENGTRFPTAAVRFPKEFMVEFEARFEPGEKERRICVTFPTFRLTWSANHGEGNPPRTARFIFSTLDGVPRIWVNENQVSASEMTAEKGDFGSIQIQNLDEEKMVIRHLVLWRGEVCEDFFINYRNFAKNEEKKVAFDCGLEYYVVGNNLFVSNDSRNWGSISPQQILGSAVLVKNE